MFSTSSCKFFIFINCVKYRSNRIFDSTRYEYQISHIGFDGFDDLDDDEENEDPDTTGDPINEVDVKVYSISVFLDRLLMSLTSILRRCTFLGLH